MTWLPVTFRAPTRVEVPGTAFHCRPIAPEDTELDMVAVMGSQERLWAIYGQAWGWPPATMTSDQDRADLARHAAEMERNQSFNFAILNGDESALVGCIYVDPPERAGSDADISWWVIDELVGSRLEGELAEFVPRWIASEWPFSEPRFIGVDISWDDWLDLPEI